MFELPDPLDSEAITDRKVVINQLWTDLKDLTDARSLALAGAKEIHTFNRDAADAKERVQVCTVHHLKIQCNKSTLHKITVFVSFSCNVMDFCTCVMM